MVKLLLRHGAKPNIRDKNGSTPLILAAIRGWTAITKELLGYGAERNVRDVLDKSPLLYATEKDHRAVFELLRQRDVAMRYEIDSSSTLLSLAA